ncbi:MAG: DUF3418 domain-containing protein, partial [Acidimicrobiales bacterium]
GKAGRLGAGGAGAPGTTGAAGAGAVGEAALEPSLTDIRRELAGLVYPGFVTATGASRLRDLVRYLRAVSRRLERLPGDVRRDQQRMLAVLRLQRAWRDLPPSSAAIEIRWMIEELRVSLWAQSLGTPAPVSEERIRRALAGAVGAI